MLLSEQVAKFWIDGLLETKREVPSLLEFFKGAWLVLEPGVELHINWHLELECEYLEQISDGKLQYLVVNVMPRSAKSRLFSVCFPCWWWLKKPSIRGLFLSYSSKLANDLSDDRRKLIQSDWYQEVCGGMKLSASKNRISEYENEFRGAMLARGLEQGVTGSGGDYLLFDDPNNPDKVESDLVREATNRRFKDYSTTRKNNPAAPVIIVQQRTHQEDVTGWTLENLPGQYVHLNLQNEATEEEEFVFPVSGKVVKRSPGDLLDPGRMTRDYTEMAKKALGMQMYAARFQQRPAPAEGAIIKQHWWQYYRYAPPLQQVVQSWDTAFKTGQDNDYSVCTTWGIGTDGYYLLDLYREKIEFPDLERMVSHLARLHNCYTVLVEDKASGQSLIQTLQRSTRLGIIPVKVDRDKIARVHAITALIEGGRVFLPENAPWLIEMLIECSTFPNASHDDMVDSLSQFLGWIATRRIVTYRTGTASWG